MSLDSNVQCDLAGNALHIKLAISYTFFFRCESFAQNMDDQTLTGVLRNPYVFPPLLLVGQVITFLSKTNLHFTIVVPDIRPRLKQATPSFIHNLSELSFCLENKLTDPNLTPLEIFERWIIQLV